MAFQFNPIFFGFMLVVAVGTVAYTLFSSNPQAQTQQQRPRRRNGPSNNTSGNTLHLRSRHEDTESQPQAVERPKLSTTSERRRKADKEVDVCSICLEKPDKVVLSLECGHKFHYNCLKKWFDHHQTKICPNCRQEVQI